ncbi:MAG: PaaI family thioesterase, partial [Proteiniphilum sp.]|nr:PaaI family thioesterase [Proteiniphilum sp.]MDD3076395.1 PaaI family thioesterase [Proteiniphilum sp.]MDD3956225.1 PaaI family thioesterase [Proteiniphilum sp.]MDD4452547.1 PaaI family thioesterase [Proteiniphilum sp.]
TLMETLGIEFTLLSPGRVEAVMPVGKHVCQPFGILHGGATLALAESIAGQGSLLLCEADEIPAGIQVSCNHVSSAREGDKVRAVGTIIHRGRSTHVWNIDIFTASGKLVSSVRVVNSILKKR